MKLLVLGSLLLLCLSVGTHTTEFDQFFESHFQKNHTEDSFDLKKFTLENLQTVLKAKRIELDRASEIGRIIKDRQTQLEKDLKISHEKTESSLKEVRTKLADTENLVDTIQKSFRKDTEDQIQDFSSQKSKLIEDLKKQEKKHDRTDKDLLEDLKSSEDVDSIEKIIVSILANDDKTNNSEDRLDKEIDSLNEKYTAEKGQIKAKYEVELRKAVHDREALKKKERILSKEEMRTENQYNKLLDELREARSLNKRLLKDRLETLDRERELDVDDLTAKRKSLETSNKQLAKEQSSNEINFKVIKNYFNQLAQQEKTINVSEEDSSAKFLKAVKSLVQAFQFLIQKDEEFIDQQMNTIKSSEVRAKELQTDQKAVVHKLSLLSFECKTCQKDGEVLSSAGPSSEGVLKTMLRRIFGGQPEDDADDNDDDQIQNIPQSLSTDLDLDLDDEEEEEVKDQQPQKTEDKKSPKKEKEEDKAEDQGVKKEGTEEKDETESEKKDEKEEQGAKGAEPEKDEDKDDEEKEEDKSE